ncbi:MAG: TonB-dependent receptor, partial [Thermaurantiacus sp.]
MGITNFSRLAATVSACAVAAITPALGQSVGDTAAERASDGEIVVTARKREERLQDVPISISVQSGEVLENQSISSFMGLQARVPSLSVTDTPANASLFIRGIGTSGNTLSFEQSVSLFVDQIYGGRNRQFMQPFFDVERIEVLRGPQGALFGRNTSAGAISVTTRRPTRSFEGSLLGEVELVRGSHALEMTASGPVTDTLSLRIATRYNKGIGWLDNVVLDRKEPVREDVLARVSALWEPAETVSLFARLDYGKADIRGTPFEFVPGGGRPIYQNTHNDGLRPLGDTSDTLNGVIQVDVGVGTHTLSSVTGYSGFDYVNSFNIQARAPARLVTENRERFWQWSQELRLASPADQPLSYIFGGYAESSKSDIFRLSIINLPPPPVPNNETHRFFDQKTDVLAAFGQLDWKPVEELSLSGGLRWTRIIKKGNLSGFARVFQPSGAIIDMPRAPISDRFTETDWSPTASITWRPTRDVSLYGRYAQGSKGGAFSEFQAVTPDTFILRPEQSETFEVGAKLAFPAIGGFLNLAVFTTDYKDLQKSSLDINTASFVTTNAAGARTRGFELDAGFRIADGITI